MKEMREILEKESLSAHSTWKECIIPKKNGVPKQVYRTLLGVSLQFLQQWTGVNYFFYYGATIFESAGIDDPIRTQLILGTINVVMTFFGLWVVERFGRRMPLIVGAAWQAAWLAVFAAMGTAVNPEGSKASGIVMIVAAAMFIASFASTWGPIIWVVTGETYGAVEEPLRVRQTLSELAEPMSQSGARNEICGTRSGLNGRRENPLFFFAPRSISILFFHAQDMSKPMILSNS